jgi:hypothetical protein
MNIPYYIEWSDSKYSHKEYHFGFQDIRRLNIINSKHRSHDLNNDNWNKAYKQDSLWIRGTNSNPEYTLIL